MEEIKEELQEEIIEFEEPLYKVYIQVDENNIVKRIDSEWNINDLENWTFIDSGTTDKYHHSQSNYLEKGLFDELGRFNYKYVDTLIELTEEEKETLFPQGEPMPTLEERLATNEELAEEAYLMAEENSILIEIYMG